MNRTVSYSTINRDDQPWGSWGDLEFIEVQIGDRLDEGDIERVDDRYGRVA